MRQSWPRVWGLRQGPAVISVFKMPGASPARSQHIWSLCQEDVAHSSDLWLTVSSQREQGHRFPGRSRARPLLGTRLVQCTVEATHSDKSLPPALEPLLRSGVGSSSSLYAVYSHLYLESSLDRSNCWMIGMLTCHVENVKQQSYSL